MFRRHCRSRRKSQFTNRCNYSKNGTGATTVALAILSAIGALKTFDVPWLVTIAGPNNATQFLGTYIYRMGIRQAHIGYAAAISIVLLVLAVAGALVIGRANRKGANA